jgi:hypothetical protein
MATTCPHCKSGPGEACLGPAWRGKGLNSRRPLRFSAAHPQRIAKAAALEAGASDREARVAARFAVLTTQPTEIVPYLEVARMAVEDAGQVSMGKYRKHNPPAPEVPIAKAEPPELEPEPEPEPEA